MRLHANKIIPSEFSSCYEKRIFTSSSDLCVEAGRVRQRAQFSGECTDDRFQIYYEKYNQAIARLPCHPVLVMLGFIVRLIPVS